jgi:polypeptide N-acetylgalactosaminyltransferase
MIFPRRYRSLLYKLVIVVPLTWLVVVMLFYSDKRSGGGAEQNSAAEAAEKAAAEPLVQPRPDTNAPSKESGGGDETKEEPANERKEEEEEKERRRQEANNRPVLAMPYDPDAPGEMGKPVKVEKPDKDTKKKIDDGWQDNAFNQYVSDMISVHRRLPDPRDEWCKASDRFLSDLPATSVVVCFHNEAWSVLLRTVHSILDRSPKHLIDEIILVDDASTMDHLKEKLEHYMTSYPQVRIVRAPERVGLIRARLMGAKFVKAPVVTFLDSHCECTEGWLEPLLDRIARNSTNVVCPVIDVIDDDTLEYHYRDSGGVNVGGFDWNLQFNWHAVPDHEKSRHEHSAEAVRSPTMAGGLFSIDKNFFERLGTYDSGFDIWGGENLELS